MIKRLNLISIHLLRAEQDQRQRDCYARVLNFNPLAPCGARLVKRDLHHAGDDFNPLAPCGARRLPPSTENPAGEISIHLLRAEQDPGDQRVGNREAYFNPLAPCGARPAITLLKDDALRISIHLLRAEQDAEAEDEVWELRISIHLLRAEQDAGNL